MQEASDRLPQKYSFILSERSCAPFVLELISPAGYFVCRYCTKSEEHVIEVIRVVIVAIIVVDDAEVVTSVRGTTTHHNGT